MKKFLLSIRITISVLLIIVTFICITACSSEGANGDYIWDKKTFLDKYYAREENGYYTDFSKAETEEILKAFKVVFPENEADAYIHLLGRKNDEDSCSFELEIGGINDYLSFFEANAGRVDENGYAGKSWNELAGETSGDYYILYYESFSKNENALSDTDKKMYADISSVYEKIKAIRVK